MDYVPAANAPGIGQQKNKTDNGAILALFLACRNDMQLQCTV
jgi:hypothetical protein